MTQNKVIDLNAFKLSRMLNGLPRDLPNPDPIRTEIKRCLCRRCEGHGLLRVINIYHEPRTHVMEPMPSHLKAFPIAFEVALADRGRLPAHMEDYTCWECAGVGAVWREVLAQGEVA